MKKHEKGVLTIEAAISLLSVTVFVLFLFNFVRVYKAQSIVSHATMQATDAIALESYLRERCYRGDASDIAYIANHMTGSSNVTESTFVSLRNTDIVEVSKEKFTLALGKNKAAADSILNKYGVKNGVDGVDFSESTVDLKNDDIIIRAKYTVKLPFSFFGVKELEVTKNAKAKTFGEILFDINVNTPYATRGSVSGSGSYQQGKTVQITAEPAFGYKFKRWSDGSTEATREVVVEGDATYTAEFERESYGVTIKIAVINDLKKSNNTDVTNARDNDNCAFATFTGAGTYLYEDAVNITAADGQHYKIKYIKDNDRGETYNAKSFTIPSISRCYNLTIVVEPKTYTVKAVADPASYGNAYVGVSGTATTASSVNVKYGADVVFTATTVYGYEFVKWSNGKTERQFAHTVNGNMTVTASFKKSRFTVNVQSAGNGSVSGGGTYDYLTNITLSSSPNANFRLDYWECNGVRVTTAPSFSVTVTENKTYTAHFKRTNYTVTLNANGGRICVGDNSFVGSKTYSVNEGGATGNLATAVSSPENGGCRRFNLWRCVETGATYGQNANITNIICDMTLVAEWSGVQAHRKGVCGVPHRGAVQYKYTSAHPTAAHYSFGYHIVCRDCYTVLSGQYGYCVYCYQKWHRGDANWPFVDVHHQGYIDYTYR